MPRPRIRAKDTAYLRELDAAVREYERAERRLEQATERMMAALLVALDDKETNLSVTEAARRMGYSREQLSRIVSQRREVHDSVTLEDSASASTHQVVHATDSVKLTDSVDAGVTPTGTDPFPRAGCRGKNRHQVPEHANGPDPE